MTMMPTAVSSHHPPSSSELRVLLTLLGHYDNRHVHRRQLLYSANPTLQLGLKKNLREPITSVVSLITACISLASPMQSVVPRVMLLALSSNSFAPSEMSSGNGLWN